MYFYEKNKKKYSDKTGYTYRVGESLTELFCFSQLKKYLVIDTLLVYLKTMVLRE